jgi:23S rRNA pseudouridine2604 synthase
MSENTSGVRINKYLSEAGYCSRRQADQLVEEGRVEIDGEVALMGQKILPGQRVSVDGQDIEKEEEKILIAFNKPKGIVCTTGHYKDNIIEYIHYPKRIYPIGRLDKDSTGLILLTNQGEIVNRILKASNYHEKEYVVTVNKDLTREFLDGMANGVPILDTVTRKCKVKATGRRTFRIVLTQGLNRQIRRMCEYFDYRVVKLNRVRIMNIELGDLEIGKYRDLTEEEIRKLESMLK